MDAATIPVPNILRYTLDTNKLFKEVRHYNLIEGEEILSNKLNISINRGFSKAKYTYSVKKWLGIKWSKQITGLFPTHEPNIYFGDTCNRRNFLLMRFENNGTTLKVYYFKNYYPSNKTQLINKIKE